LGDRLLRIQEVAEICNVEITTIQSWMRRNYGPKPLKISKRCLRYSEKEVQEFISSLRNTASK
jgi:predicted DNA-binding transcriptional regulator AlpA